RPIHFAASNGNDELVELLVQAGADISAPVKPHLGIVGTGVEFFKGCGLGLETGATAYDLARTNKHWKLADWIKKHGGKSGMAKKE
ncbi:MAG TPA: hypothetical protein VNT79_06220, partial [Phycisphaerae bacterium]|nr:hypothetical protein [Phycisphaerae bacterium]